MKAKSVKTSRKDLERRVVELESQLIHRYHAASVNINGADKKHLMGSGVILRLTGIGGQDIVSPVMIKDGLSNETISAIRKDLVLTYELSNILKPIS